MVIYCKNLKFRNELLHNDVARAPQDVAALSTIQKILYGVFTIGGEWLWARITRLSINQGWGDMAEDDWQRKVWKIMTYVENTYRALTILNFVLFLRNGQYVSLINRILGMRLVYNKANMTRRVSFELLNRQLVWLGFSEFLLFLLPLINMDRIKKLHIQKIQQTTSRFNTFYIWFVTVILPCMQQ